ncbi:hypothetical protein OS493_011207 [Desmophyllum pertusum]|uniref:Uncharacterized protein n=1 Tax=Desmophyllum pertusum TaxID=174260 RepID=A0A9X0CRQ8_9CNID|nr:hypothetical protein OS493_011207 [Desmophyllum pertusum]
MTAIDETRQRTFYVALTFSDKVANKDYAMTGIQTGKGKDITIEAKEVKSGDALGDESVFEPMYYWSYTMFRNKSYNNLYLGCDNTGKTTLVENVDLNYPNPQALFVLNKVTFLTGA